MEPAQHRATHLVEVTAAKIWLSRKDGGRYRDNQIWKHDPLGRLVLVAWPHLCLSAATRKAATSRLHLWEMVEVKIRLSSLKQVCPPGKSERPIRRQSTMRPPQKHGLQFATGSPLTGDQASSRSHRPSLYAIHIPFRRAGGTS